MNRTAAVAALALALPAAAGATDSAIPLDVAQLEMNPCTKEPMVVRLHGQIGLAATSAAGTSRYAVQIRARGTSYGQESGSEYEVEAESSRTYYFGGAQAALIERQTVEFVGPASRYGATFLYRLAIDADGRLSGTVFRSSYACR